jgi:ATP-dependent Clp protease ATP-binding subunit ClpC
LQITDKAKEFIANKGYDIQYGARPLKRALQKYLEDELAELLLKFNAEDKVGATINVDYVDGEDKLSINLKEPDSDIVAAEN